MGQRKTPDYKHIVVSPTVFEKLEIRKGKGSFNELLEDILKRVEQSPKEKLNNMLLDVEKYLKFEIVIDSTIPAEYVFSKLRATLLKAIDNPSILPKLDKFLNRVIEQETPEQEQEAEELDDLIKDHTQ